MISSLASKCQDFKVEMPFFQPLYVMKLKTSNLKVLAFCCQWRYFSSSGRSWKVDMLLHLHVLFVCFPIFPCGEPLLHLQTSLLWRMIHRKRIFNQLILLNYSFSSCSRSLCIDVTVGRNNFGNKIPTYYSRSRKQRTRKRR